MTVGQRLSELNERIFDSALLDSLRAAYEEEEKSDPSLASLAEDYRSAKAALPHILNERQAADVALAESLSLEGEEWGMRFAYTRGVFSGFEQYFTPADAESAFKQRVADQLLWMPNMQYYKEHYKRCNRINALFEKAKKGLSESDAEKLTDIQLACADRQLGILRHAFYTGYRYALYIENTIRLDERWVSDEKRVSTERSLDLIKNGKKRVRL